MYDPQVTFFLCKVEQDVMWLSFWLFENQIDSIDEEYMGWRFWDEMEEGDQLDVWVDMGFGIVVKRCGIHLLYHHKDLQGSQSNDILAAISHKCLSIHQRRFLTSNSQWLTFNCNYNEATPLQIWYSEKSFNRWSSKREQRVNKIPTVQLAIFFSFPLLLIEAAPCLLSMFHVLIL